MSLPRPVISGRCYLLTRRCSERRFLMRPDDETTNAFLYCLGVAANRTKVEVLFYLAMSNHYHAGVVDTAGRLPEFLHHFHKLFAKHQNVLRGRWENFWASEQTSAVELADAEDVFEKMVYTLTNPVKAHLVKRAERWPGASSLSAQLSGSEITATRPLRFFRPDGAMPESVTFSLHRPPSLASMTSAEYLTTLRERIALVEAEMETQRMSDRVRLVGSKRVRRQPWSQRPISKAPRRGLRPRIAARNIWRRVEAIRRNKAFIDAYRAARQRLLDGLEAIFPIGTYWLSRFAGHSCEPLSAVA